MPENYLEPELEPDYRAWKERPGPDTAAALLRTLAPTIDGAIRAHVGASSPLLVGRARRMTLQGLRAYEPHRSRLRTHLYNHLQGLKRAARRQSTVLGVPERVALDRSYLENEGRSLEHELGRPPSDAELADRTGIALARIARVRRYRPPVAEGRLVDAETGDPYDVAAHAVGARAESPWLRIAYDELDPHHQKIMELTLGWHGHRRHSNREVAAALGRSPGAISQAKARIQARIDALEAAGLP